MAQSQALLYIQLNPPAGNEAAFDAWYDEHQARRTEMPGFLNARRYRNTDGDGPRILATYDLADASALTSRAYQQLRAQEAESAPERAMLGSAEVVARRVYRSIDTDEPWAAAWTDHAPYVMSVALEPPPDKVEDFHAWYRQEHSPMLMKALGWRRIRRYEQAEGNGPRFMALHELTTLDGNADGGALARKAADFILAETGDDPVRFATHWTDDMFMATSVLARVAAQSGEAKYATAAGRLLTSYAQRLQRGDGLFIHAENGPSTWGRGNGFAAFGLIEALTHLPENWPARPQVRTSYERLMAALQRTQAPDGAWRQVIDEPGSYREFTATAMITTAMARGIRLGWLDKGRFQPVVDRAWQAVLARVSEAGELVDVCTGTGAGQNATREYYLNRSAIFGPDDRGGAMALTAALEIHALRAAK